ncbi:UNVERIFIED_CONTAM: hypothetical protein NO986_24660 [Comamonas sp. A-3]|uniref:hypothetical protein n=1 Tax=Comamonas TaxID=283 RepID=UPI0001DA67AD|nr:MULTISPECIES: hypothetical protein [Comamonas]EFI62042.1 hypothetical protein CTS44_08837 [Comamonas thiooxydans]TFF61112.1 hypothetical protein EIC84_12875 [Comamonas sp. A23]TYK71973.1 hypothetical protein FSY45_22625 [Comamonas sp. Z1]
MPVPFDLVKIYDHLDGHISCQAFDASNHSSYVAWLSDDVAARVFDKPTIDAFESDIAALSAEGFDVSALVEIHSEPYSTTSADIGEGIADLFLAERHNSVLPSNRRRDLKNPNASQAGADIAGYVLQADGTYCFLFGEVKTSSEKKSPPSVMTHIHSGMAVQLQRVSDSRGYQRTLMFYLRERSQDAANRPLYQSALENLAAGKFQLVGVLLRDTKPDVLDVRAPMAKMRAQLPTQQLCHLYVLHTCLPTSDWLQHCQVA